MQSTGQTSMQASQPGQLSARMTANSLGSFFLALPAPFAMRDLSRPKVRSSAFSRIDRLKPELLTQIKYSSSIFSKTAHFNKGRLAASGTTSLGREDRRRR